jgi:hypothetical protein
MTSVSELRKRVSRGSKLLDRKSPGWERRIKLGRLDLSDPNSCILGQGFRGVIAEVFPNGNEDDDVCLGNDRAATDNGGYLEDGPTGFAAGLRSLFRGEIRERDVKNGFNLFANETSVETSDELGIVEIVVPGYDALTALWKIAVKERRKAA